MKSQLKILSVICALVFLFCTNVEFNNPLDIKGTNPFSAEKLKDDDGNGVPNIYEDDDHDGILNIDDPNSILHVVDTIKPVFSIQGNDHFLGNDTVPILLGGSLENFKSEVKAKDNVEGDISNRIEINSSSVSSISPGIYPVTFLVSDMDQNSVTITRFVKVYINSAKDNTPPVISFGNDTIRLMVGDQYIEQTATAFDLFEGKNVPVTSTGKVDTSKAGTYSIVYTAKDGSNNEAKKTKTVIVEAGVYVDREQPVITLLGKESMEIKTFAEFIEPGYTARDNHDGDLTSKVVKMYGEFKAGAKAGQYILKYTVQDSAENSATAIRKVCLDCGSIDVTKPTFSIQGGDTMYTISLRGKTHPVTANDDKDGNLTDSIQRSSSPKYDSTKAGTYVLTYSVADEALNFATLRVTVTVVDPNRDTTKPVITVRPKNPDTVAVDSTKTYTDPGATAKDGEKTIQVTKSGSVDLKTPGSYTITYTATDSTGNVGTATRTVVVKEVGNDLLFKYSVPGTSALPAISNGKYESYTVEGIGTLTITGFKSLEFNWSNSTMNSFQITMTGAPYNKDLRASSTIKLSTVPPQITISGLTETSLSGLNATWYVAKSGTNLVWVKKDGSLAIVWKP
jgi:hypothetical protein